MTPAEQEARRIAPNPEARNPIGWQDVETTDLRAESNERLIQTVGWLKHLAWMAECRGDYGLAHKILHARVQVEGELERRMPTPVFQGAAE